MQPIFVFYSHEGNCRAVAQTMAEKTGGETEELKLVNNTVPASGFMKYFHGGKQALFRDEPELAPLGRNLSEYSPIIIGSPVWASGMAPAVRSFISSVEWTGRKTAVFVMHRGGKGGALGKLQKLLAEKGATVLGGEAFVDLRRGDSGATLEAAREWAATMIRAAQD